MLLFFFFNDTATTEIYTLSLHDALPILSLVGLLLFRKTIVRRPVSFTLFWVVIVGTLLYVPNVGLFYRSEEHTSELQSRPHLVCRLLLEKKKNIRCDCSGVLARLY